VINPLSLDTAFPMGGLLFGSAVSAVCSDEYAPYRTGGNPAQKIARYLIEIVILGLLWVALGALTPSGGIGALAMDYFLTAIAGALIILGAPLLYVKLMLMMRDES
jgi:hypothetical protein